MDPIIYLFTLWPEPNPIKKFQSKNDSCRNWPIIEAKIDWLDWSIPAYSSQITRWNFVYRIRSGIWTWALGSRFDLRPTDKPLSKLRSKNSPSVWHDVSSNDANVTKWISQKNERMNETEWKFFFYGWIKKVLKGISVPAMIVSLSLSLSLSIRHWH